MNRGANPSFAVPNSVVEFFACFVGNGAADMTLATNAQYPKIANFGVTATRTSIGLYVVTLTEITAQLLYTEIECIGTSTISAKVKVAFSPTTKIGQINILDQTGALADPTSNDTIIIMFQGRDSTS